MNHNPARASIEWAKLREKSERLRQRLAGAGQPAERTEAQAAVLRERARMLAQPARDAAPPLRTLPWLLFALGENRFGLEVAHVREVVAVTELTPLPAVPAFVAGVLPLRGELVSVIDLKAWFELPPKGLSDFLTVIVLTSAMGLLVDRVLGTADLHPDELHPAPATLQGHAAAAVRGRAPDGTALVDGEKLMAERGLIIDET